MRLNSISARGTVLVLCITKHYNLVQVYAPMTSYSEEDINSFYNDVDENLGILMGDFNAQIGGGGTYGNGNGQIWARIEKRKRRHLGRMGNVKKVQNH